MKNKKLTTAIFGMTLLLAGCAADDALTTQGQESGGSDIVGTPVLFTVGDVGQNTMRAATPYMAEGGRFVCTMYYHAKANDTDDSDFDIQDAADGGTMTTAWLKVNNGVGNSVYWNKEYANRDNDQLDGYGFDKTATMFYWQNRLKHAFLALADYNKLTTNDGTSFEQGKLKLYPNGDGAEDKTYNTYDLTRGSKTAMAQQPDPIMALTVMKPAGATQEANRVKLYFRHQFSQIQVNIKGADDNSANISANQIAKVELLGVSTEGYVSNHLNANGTVTATRAKDVNVAEFSDAVLDKNPWGTSFQMFDMKTDHDDDGIAGDDGYAIGFLKSYNAIAFGMLHAIRITWYEGTKEAPGVIHESTFQVPRTTEQDGIELINLQSGMKYVYDLELRRGTLAVIRTQILDWKQKEELVYTSDGTITN